MKNELSRLRYYLSQVHTHLNDYRLRQDASAYYISSQEKLIQAIESFIRAAEDESAITRILLAREEELVSLRRQVITDKEMIQKLALLVAISGLKHPHVQTPTWMLHQIYQYKRGDAEAFCVQKPITTIELPGI
jgi:hypothetical protein